MKLGLRRRYFKLLGNLGVLRFNLIRFLYGFDSANNYLKRANKYAVIPILKLNKATIGKLCDIETGITYHNCKKDYSNLIIGDNCHIGKNCFLDLRDKILIGNNVTISMNTILLTHQDFGKSQLSGIYHPKNEKLIIGDNVYIGASSTLLMGIEIGNNSLIAAGSIVVDNVASRSIVGGVPGRIIKELN